MKKQLLVALFLVLALLMVILPWSAFADATADAGPAKQADAAAAAETGAASKAGSLTIKGIEGEIELEVFKGAFLRQWLHMLDSDTVDESSQSGVLAYASRVPEDLARILAATGEGPESPGFPGVLWRSLLALVLGFCVFILTRKVARSRFAHVGEAAPAEPDGFALLGLGVLRSLPSLIGLLLFGVAATLIFLGLAGDIEVKGRVFFQALLGTVLVFLLCSIIGRIIFSPGNASLRPVKIADSLVKPLYRAFFISSGVLISGLLIVYLVEELGARPQTVTWVVMVLGSVVIAIYVYLVLYLKRPLADALLAQLEKSEGGWFRKQLAARWYAAALAYLFLVWLIWLGQQLTGTATQNGVFIVSMLIIPIYLLLSYSGRAVIQAVVSSLQLGRIEAGEQGELSEEEKLELEEQKRGAITARTHAVFRLILLGVLAVWLLSFWGVNIPFAAAAVGALFQSLVTLALALLCWRFASSYIERKLEEGRIEIEAAEEDEDDEFGGAVQRGRSHTLLPMVRKAIGTVLVVMVLLIIISSLGVNIAPLLAGAGVIGLAVGFGAQKLVSDVLSGFFFLLDDAFRVGEYIQTGSIRGTVESITLRNVMLRHHLGMLQVVPHSDLGAVTNYMRGGIVIKFPLEFPYDTDIDQVRKIIKKVGIAMLEDEELADDFIAPLKSQGVHEITNSVMVIRVKFTAKPGKQFVIKREAFRRITEALAAKGIFYAHRKVIVDFPEHAKIDTVSPEDRMKALEAGAAAAITEADSKAEQKPKE
jgi:small-conductance mechanosensitive channel